MRLYCHYCGKVQRFTARSFTASCLSCGHEQSFNSIKSKDNTMPRKPKEHGSLTGSKRFKPSESVAERLVNEAKQVGGAFNHASEAVASVAQQVTSKATPVMNAAAPLFNAVSNVSNQRSSTTINHGVALPQFDVNSALGTDLYSSDSSIPSMSITEATQHKMKIARQGNALSVAHDKAKLSRKAVAVATELEHLKGDSINLATVRVHTGTKELDYTIALTEQSTKKSLLKEKQELLTHQQLSTAGTIALTPHVAQKQRLRVIKGEQDNNNTRLDIERGDADMDRKRKELEVHILEATLL